MRQLISLRKTAGAASVLVFGLVAGACTDTPKTGIEPNMSERPDVLRSTVSIPPEGERRNFAKAGANQKGRARIQVNGFAWRAALAAISFMPLRASDPYGGAITTEWYAPPATPNERLKVNILVSGPDLQSDSVKVTVFRQVKGPKGEWVDAKVSRNTALDLENVILQRAREMRNTARNR